MAIKHGQALEAARVNFERAILKAKADHSRWIHKVDWADDRKSAVLHGPSYAVTLSFDDQHVYAKGKIPLALKLFEGPVRRYVEHMLADMAAKPDGPA
ncbi:hypothetical protein OJF2_04270 [Aquisphaera giovannonii]|uniref:Polyhydroxyalkanoic acid system protein (PHA_gran_rgn) n=1 Tax=Aquisphaera giovannonii TaxID=406548 RepID=A0A5B9VW62_9BACT|nr:hypothetical protein OJF2_04270 [Aquisphaera giovannonii]